MTTSNDPKVNLTDEQWREFRIGAWLHDCGKVTTPEHIVDKATKLETVYNRIHEIRMRFEVLLRDAMIERLAALAAGEPARMLPITTPLSTSSPNASASRASSSACSASSRACR